MPTSLKLHIPEPCHENWQNMTPQAQGRFCGSCQKTVVDFSVMTDKEILEYFSKASQHVCGRFSNDQLNKDLKVTDKKKRFSLAYVWNIILATLLMTEANAQVKPKLKKPVTINTWEGRKMGEVAYIPEEPVGAVIPVTMSGTIMDAQNNQPVDGASISIKGASGGTMADTSGIFRLKVEKKNSLVLEISAIGYETQTRVIDNLTHWQAIQVYLKPAASELQEVVITSYTMGKMSMTGCNGVRIKKDTIKSVINNWMPAALKTVLKKDVKIYPNPVVRGNSIQVKLALPQTGGYKLELLNTAGQVMMVQPLLMQTKEQQIDLYTQANWSAGIYWVRISSPDTKNVFQGKVLVK
jgi:carboxypeptidase-like protein/type IX secretion system substrate protein